MAASTTPTPTTRPDLRGIPDRAGRPRLYKPLILRLADIPGVTPLRIFVVVGLITGLVSWRLHMPIVTALNTAYGLAMVNYLVRRQQHLLIRLRPLITLDDAHFRYERYALERFRHVVIIGLSLLAPVALIAVNWNSVVLRTLLLGHQLPLADVWGFVLAMLDWILIIQVSVIMVSNAWRFYRLGLHHTRISLLDTGALAPFALAGIAVLICFAGAYTLVPIAAFSHIPSVLAASLRSLVVCLPILIAGTLLPVLGIHRNLHAAKAAEVDRINRAVHGDRSALAETHLAAESETVPLSNLVLYRQTVSDINEWPIDSVAGIRTAIIVIVPVVAWLAGAVGDKLMDKLFG